MKSIIRLLGLVFFLSGWAVAAFCVHIVRVPDAGNVQQSKFVIVPKNRLGLDDTYVDARRWTMADVKTHPLVVLRLLRAGKAEELKFLADPKSNKDIETQLTDYLSDTSAEPSSKPSSAIRMSVRPAAFVRDLR